MSTIVFVMLPEEGHLGPTFKLAKSLKSRGHRVCYMVNYDYEDYVRAQDYECVVFSKDFWKPPSSTKLTLPGPVEEMNEIIWANRGEICKLLERIDLDLLVVDAYMPAMALIARENGFSMVFLNVAFDNDTPTTLLNTLEPIMDETGLTFKSLLKVPQLITYPREFEFPHVLSDGRAYYYIEASLDLEKNELPFDWSRIHPEKPLIYCTLGSQCHLFKGSRQFFQTIIDAISSKPDWQMILSVGKHLSTEFENVASNVFVVDWAPQLAVLKRASLMITHGGIGTLKDCIFFGVPMIVFPMMRDQPMSGARVVYHKLGVRGNIHHVTVEQVHSLIEKIEQDKGYRERVEQMSQTFRKMEQSGKGVRIIEKMLNFLSQKNALGQSRTVNGPEKSSPVSTP